MSFFLSSCTRAARLHIPARTCSISSMRFLSSKKSDNKPEDAQALAPPRKKRLAKTPKEDQSGEAEVPVATGQNVQGSKAKPKPVLPKSLARNYIAFKDLPKPSEDLQEMSLGQLNPQLNPQFHMTSPGQKGVPKHELLMPFVGFKYDFDLSAKHRLANRISKSALKRPHGPMEPNLALLGISLDADTLSSGLEEHPLRESITGMCVMNPLLKEIKNKSLWELFPENKKYGTSPFGHDASFNAFKDWEDLKNAKLKTFEIKKQEEEKEFRDFCKNLLELKSFVRKNVVLKAGSKKASSSEKSTKDTDSKISEIETSGRRKLDRGLLKQYRKYRKEQYLKDSKDDKEEE